MSSFESDCMISSIDRDDNMFLGSCEFPKPSFLINDPDADSYTSYILEDPAMSIDESDDLSCDFADPGYLTTPTQSPCSLASTSVSRQEHNSANPVSITLQRLIDQQSQLISNAFESWRRKFPINSCLSANVDLSPPPQSSSQQNSRRATQALPEHGDKQIHELSPSRAVELESPSNAQEFETLW